MIGIDFGTTNSTVAAVSTAGEVRFASYTTNNGDAKSGADPLFRSALYFPDPEIVEADTPYVYLGREAVEHYEAAPESGRLIKSLKTFLTAETINTRIHGKEWTLDALLALLVRQLVKFSESALGKLEGPIVIGRPVNFVHQRGPADEERALGRIRAAFAKAGINDISFEYEPIAAAYTYEATLDHDEVVRVGDFGGGTSDVSVVQVGPRSKSNAASERVLARGGLGIAGDVLDGRVLYHAACPLLGLGRQCRNSLTGAVSDVPRWFYSHLSDPARHFMLREPKSLALLGRCLSEAQDERTKRQLENFETVVVEGLSYQLFHRASYTKAEISTAAQTDFAFDWDTLRLKTPVQKSAFERWIAPDVVKIMQVVDDMLGAASLKLADIDRVFLTGGSAQVPLIRQAFVRKFGDEKIARLQGFFTSVAEGLARRAQQLATPP